MPASWLWLLSHLFCSSRKWLQTYKYIISEFCYWYCIAPPCREKHPQEHFLTEQEEKPGQRVVGQGHRDSTESYRESGNRGWGRWSHVEEGNQPSAASCEQDEYLPELEKVIDRAGQEASGRLIYWLT